MKKVLLFAVAVATTSLFASTDGATLTKTCVQCHGASFDQAPKGNSHHIIHDSKERIVKMLKEYKHPNPKDAGEVDMEKQVRNLTDDQINLIAEYIVQGTPSSAREAVKLTKSCATCHGVKFNKAPEGNDHHLITDSKERIVDMLKEYKHPNPNDPGEVDMGKQVKDLTDEEINTIADYIIHMRTK